VFKPAKWWPLVVLTSVLPLSAILHHLLFYPTTCMLAPFGVTDYTSAGVAAWLRADWSPRLAIAIAGCAYFLGIRSNDVRAATLAFVVAFAPLAVWIWDIPWSSRIVCRFLHDGRAGLLTRHLYVSGAVIWLMLASLLRRARPRAIEPAWSTAKIAVP
jgi:hypothetical protein